MKAAVYNELGPVDVIQIEDVPQPQAGPGQVVVEVKAAGINPYDDKVRTGFIETKAPFPRRVGSDMAGVVVAVGEGAQYWNGNPAQVGDKVMGRAKGSVAERAVADVARITPLPIGLDYAPAGALDVAGLTAVSLLATVPVGPEDTVLVGGATGAVGMVAAQLALQAGARVLGTCSQKNIEFVRSLGADPVVYGEGLAERVKETAAITAVMDCHGTDALEAGIALGVPKDRMVAIAAYSAVKELGVLNVEFAARTAENLSKLAEKIADGTLVFPVALTFPLDQVRGAFTAMDGPHAPGKIVILPQL